MITTIERFIYWFRLRKEAITKLIQLLLKQKKDLISQNIG